MGFRKVGLSRKRFTYVLIFNDNFNLIFNFNFWLLQLSFYNISFLFEKAAWKLKRRLLKNCALSMLSMLLFL